jgi:two-component system sensor histidine kinase QseC
MRNVVENAILASQPGQEVMIEIGEDAAGLSVTVVDDGPGMSDVELQAATGRFYRGTNGGKLGSGLGLSIVETAMTRLRGALTIENRPGGGLSVRLSSLA